ncbi:hypothetical protein HDF26_003156 [Pedobacter cryoconitis]|uniref:Uncharacterized protein n=1 Tax=Pedobacter cryoconitis TaxID=188932 RepID=A0A7W9DY56_9SPHI|nr:hypothetical protein [Pedobacter cryoconitis]MBB6272699.1 hypothetical protein [Pedobacter cryoconitis]
MTISVFYSDYDSKIKLSRKKIKQRRNCYKDDLML